jgi:deazaflavin-dependent oxidoreductase (nitroreductase family)
MDDSVRRAIERGLTCDITTIGRSSGRPRRIEIWYFVAEGRVYITGTPGRRDWYANIQADPRMTFHVKQGARADLPARAMPISDPAERRRIMGAVMRQNSWFSAQAYNLDAWVAGSPLIEVAFEEKVKK